MKRLLSGLLSISMIFALCSPAYTAESGEIQKVNTYSEQFTDVPASSWYAQYVQIAYEYGLMNGTSSTLFSPDSNLSVAEALAIACRMHSLLAGNGVSFSSGEPWYQPYVDYALNNKILMTGNSYVFTDSVTRADFALFISNALPDEMLPVINEIYFPDIPDLYSGSPLDEAIAVLRNADILAFDDAFEVFYLQAIFEQSLGITENAGSADVFSAVYRLYKAGILTGNDEYGTFTPDANITRSAIAAIVSRVVESSLRQRFTLTPKPKELVPMDQLANLSSLQKKASRDELAQAYEVAKKIVEPLAGLSRETQLCGIALALRVMDDKMGTYSMSAPHYNDPYGFFVLHTASCAGCVRATGLCLNILGIPYEHVNEDQYSHQWTRVNVNGTYWICDAYGLYCGPEKVPYEHPNV